MAKYVCSVCGYVYDEAAGIPETGITAGTTWDQIPEDWTCPLCGATKDEFERQGEPAPTLKTEATSTVDSSSDMKEMSALELSALCSNLARGCEKQYKHKEAALFKELSDYFKNTSSPADNPDYSQLVELVEKDLEEGIPNAKAAATSVEDRGALRALVWSEKVTRIQKSLLGRYQRLGDAMLENTGVYVCTICGFIYIGDALPEVCPVCKVPNWKFEKVEGR